MIAQDVIDKIIDRADICEVVEDYISLKKRGINYVACCPFHTEKTPSFTVFPKSGTFKCFGCGKQGNSVGFVMEYENLTFPEALKKLASKYSIPVEDRSVTAKEEQD